MGYHIEKKNGKRKQELTFTGAALLFYDLFAIHLSFFLALWFRFDCQYNDIPKQYFEPYLHFITAYAIITVLIYEIFHLYSSIWQFASYMEVYRSAMAVMISGVIHVILITILFQRMPITYYVFGVIFQGFFTVMIRFAIRFIKLEKKKSDKVHINGKIINVMLVGAGNAGRMIMRDIAARSEIGEKVVCIIDDDPKKLDHYIDGVRIVGNRDDILESVQKYKVEKIYVAMPGADKDARRDILNICNEAGVELKSLPGVLEYVNGNVDVNSMKTVSVEDLLGREPIEVDLTETFVLLHNKTVLVTGGGGSIGSELCRQIAAHSPKQLIIFDVYENNAYDIQQELLKKHPDLDLVVLIGSVRDSRRIEQVFADYRPEVVYHAAAHKHVPLMEGSPCEAIKNNAIGTYKTAYAAMKYGTKRFVLISTDKAVNPTNVMGASKRLCEMIVQTFDKVIKQNTWQKLPALYEHEGEAEAAEIEKPQCEYVAVRFGNVLGSNGSVIPLFKKQIEAGGPVTVTHPDIIRYFMTIPEAVRLVLTAGTYAKGGEIFVLDMGEPVKIDTLARNLIKLSGLRPDVDIKITYTGLRPGEKLFEEKLMLEEGLKKTENELIHIGCPIAFDEEKFVEDLEKLMSVSYENETNIREYLRRVVVTYHPANL